MVKNIPAREIDEVEITLDFENVIFQPVDEVIVLGDDEEIKLLFFYVKTDSNHDEVGIARCKCVAEYRVLCSKFIDISRDINVKVKDIQRKIREISMFV